MMVTVRATDLKQRKRKQGICGECPAPSDTYRCQGCRERKRAHSRKYREAHRAKGLCLRCPRPSVRFSVCRDCRVRQGGKG